MRIRDMNWRQIEAQVAKDDRCVVPIGSVEQHAYLSVAVDAILSEKVSVDAAEPLGVPVFPPINYGITPYFLAYPGTISLRISTAIALMEDVLNSLKASGFRRILFVNGHGGNSPMASMAVEWLTSNPTMAVKFHNWWNAPKTWAKVKEIDPLASHASWMENFPWTRVPGAEYPDVRKPMVDTEMLRLTDPVRGRAILGDGNFGGYHIRPDEDMLALWQVAVEETRALIEGPWPSQS